MFSSFLDAWVRERLRAPGFASIYSAKGLWPVPRRYFAVGASMEENARGGYPTGKVFRDSNLATVLATFGVAQNCSEFRREPRTTRGRKSDAIAEAPSKVATAPSETKTGIL